MFNSTRLRRRLCFTPDLRRIFFICNADSIVLHIMGILFTSFHECHYGRRDVTFTFSGTALYTTCFISWSSSCFHFLILIWFSFSDPHRAWYTGSAWLLTFPRFASSPWTYSSGILAYASCPHHHGHLFLITTRMLRYTTCSYVSDVVTFTHTNRFHIHIACFDHSPNIDTSLHTYTFHSHQ